MIKRNLGDEQHKKHISDFEGFDRSVKLFALIAKGLLWLKLFLNG